MDSFDNFQYDSASSYGGMGVVDDTSSVYTANTQDNVSVDMSGLSLSEYNPSSSGGNGYQGGGEGSDKNGAYEEDFDAVLDDLKDGAAVDLPPHACRYVALFNMPLLPLRDCGQLLRHSQPGIRRQVSYLLKVVLQLAR